MIIALKLPTVPQNGLTDELNLVSMASSSRIQRFPETSEYNRRWLAKNTKYN
jgi:hypothetical protein